MPAAGHCTYLDGGRSRDYGDKPSKCSLNPHLQRTKTLLEREKGKCVQLHLLSAIIFHYYQFMSPDLLLNLPKLSLDKPTGRKTAWSYKKCTVVTDPCEIRDYTDSTYSSLLKAKASPTKLVLERHSRLLSILLQSI